MMERVKGESKKSSATKREQRRHREVCLYESRDVEEQTFKE